MSVATGLKRTPLHSEHVSLGAKLVPFAGFEMPVHYSGGITAEHRAVRERSGLFDVSHMAELYVRGPDALALVQHITVNDVSRLTAGRAQYSAMCLPQGGIVDDLVVYAFADCFMLVVNAANHDKDLAWIHAGAQGLDVEVTDRSEETALLAVQGPAARAIVEALSDLQVDRIGYYRFAEGTVAGIPAIVSATGYTGEDGFELYVAAEDAVQLWRALLKTGGAGIEPAGLGARDSLRLEMGYPLYGNDLDEVHTPLEAGLGWLTKLDKGDFIGREALLAQKERGLPRRLVGFTLEEKGFPRPGYAIRSGGRDVGVLSSGTLSPTLGKGIGMGYVPAELANPGTRLEVDLRGKPARAVVVSLPFHTKGSLRR